MFKDKINELSKSREDLNSTLGEELTPGLLSALYTDRRGGSLINERDNNIFISRLS